MRPPMTLRALANRMSGIRLGILAALTAAFVGWIVYAFGYLTEVALGPQAMTLSQLSAMAAPEHNLWLDFTTEAKPRHLLQTTTRRRRGGTSITNHFALFSKDKAVIFETSADTVPPRLLAWASEFDQSSNTYQRARSQLDKWSGTGAKFALSPVLLQTSLGVSATQNFAGGSLALVTLALTVMLWGAGRQMLDYKRVKPIAALNKSIRAPEGVDALTAEIDQQLAVRDPTARRTGLIVLPSWLLNVGGNSFSVLARDDLVWAAPYVIKRKLYGLITTSTRNEVILIDRNGQRLEVGMPENQVKDFLIAMYHWAPWITVGNDDAMEARFGKKGRGIFSRFKATPSREELIKTIDERRAQVRDIWAAQANQPPAPAQAATTPSADQTPMPTATPGT